MIARFEPSSILLLQVFPSQQQQPIQQPVAEAQIAEEQGNVFMSFLNKRQKKTQKTPLPPTPVNVVNELEIAGTEREPLHVIVDKVHEYPQHPLASRAVLSRFQRIRETTDKS